MRYYFLLQFKMINRHLAGFGIHPAMGYVLIVAVFTGFSILLFEKIAFAEYVFMATGLSFTAKLSGPARNQFLKGCFRANNYLKVRILENVIIILPFVIFLIIKFFYFQSLITLILAGFLSVTTFGSRSGLTIPTPFGKKPFEFAIGFRGSFPLFILAYFLAVMSVVAENFNLGIASLILVFLVCMSYYLNPENEFYVWIFHSRPGKFIFSKIKTAIVYSTILTIPVIIILTIFFLDKALIIIAFLLLGYLYLLTVILAKYSAYPHPVNLPQVIILAVSAWFPPLLLAVVPFFYRQSVSRLKNILA